MTKGDIHVLEPPVSPAEREAAQALTLILQRDELRKWHGEAAEMLTRYARRLIAPPLVYNPAAQPGNKDAALAYDYWRKKTEEMDARKKA